MRSHDGAADRILQLTKQSAGALEIHRRNIPSENKADENENAPHCSAVTLSPAPRLRPARIEDLDKVLTWTTSADAVRLWAGPNLCFPVERERLWQDFFKSPGAPFVLCAGAGELLAFGQVTHREENYAHLARLIVAPDQRGRGLGRALCRELLRIAPTFLPVRWCSLYVYPENTRAVALYRSVGFVEARRERGFIRMEAPLDVAR